MGKSLTETAKAILMNEGTALAATLRPGSASMDPPQSLGSAQLVADAPKAPGAGSNVGAAAAGMLKKDMSKPTQGARPAEIPKPMAEELEEDSEALEEGEDYVASFKEKGGVIKKGKTVRAKGAYPPKKGPVASRGAKNATVSAQLGYGKKLAEGASSMPAMPEDQPAKSHNSTIKNYNQDRMNEEEEVEISEELDQFIDALVAEGYSEEQIAQAIEENFEILEEEVEEIEEDAEDVLEDYEVDMQEAMNALFAGEELSEEFKAKAATIFEAAVKLKLAEELAVLEEAYAATLSEEVSKLEEGLTSNVDDYLNYVVEQWTSDNEIAIEAGLRTELTEDFISGLRNLFTEHYIDIPEDKINVLEEMGNQVEQLTDKLNEEIERNVALNKMLNESKTNEVLTFACEGLTDTQANKLKTLAEGIEYSDANEYAQKLNILKENYFSTSVKSGNVLDSVESVSDGRGMIAEELSGPMAKYVQTLGRTLPK